MEKLTITAPTKIEAITEAKKKLVETENNLLIKVLKEEDNEVVIEVIEKREILNFITNYIKELLKNIGYQSIDIEVTNKETVPTFTIYSENDSLLIGKTGRNLKALQTITINALRKELEEPYKFVINISDYKEQREKSLIKLANNIAREVKETKIDAKLDSMNSYERRIIHNALVNNKYVYTKSEGIEPNRYIVIKARETN